MANRHISYRSEFGVALHETGLNALSAGLRAARPELFAFKTEIPIVRPTAADHGHVLTLYAVADKPIAFNLYPVPAPPTIEQDSFFISANILFTLADSRLGAVTRIRIRTEAAGQIVRGGEQLNIRLLPKPDGSPWFDIISIEGEHPAAVQLLEGRIEGDLAFGEAFGETLLSDGDEETARSFRAIMNYLITLFLKEGLWRVVTEFPLPSLANLFEAGPLGKISGRDLYVRNDAVYLTLGHQNLGDGGFPALFPSANIAIGVSERGLQRVIDAMSPMPVRIDLGDDNTTLRVRSSDFHIRKIRVNLLPGEDHLFGQVYFGGTLGIRLQFKAFGKWLRTPYLPLPIDDTFSQYAGLIRPYLAVAEAGTSKERFNLRMEPDSRFLELWAVLIVTNYSSYFRELFRSLVASVKDQLIYKKLKKIPIIGWIIDKVIDTTGEVLGWVLLKVLDVFMTETLTIIMNTVGRTALQFIKRPEFTVLKIEQSAIKQLTGLHIRSGGVHQLEDGRGGELMLGLSFSEGEFPAPPPPIPIPSEPEPQPQPEPDPMPVPSLPSLPEYGADDFRPEISLPTPTWTENLVERYSIESRGSRALTGTMELRHERNDGGWRITKKLMEHGSSTTAIATADYDDQGRPLRATYRQEASHPPSERVEFSQAMDFTTAGKAKVSIMLGPLASFEMTIDMLDPARLELDEFWPFRLGHSPIGDGQGAFGRVELADPMEFKNWARQVPVKIEISTTEIDLPGETDGVAAFVVAATDEDGKTRAVVAPGHGLVEVEVKTTNGSVLIQKLW